MYQDAVRNRGSKNRKRLPIGQPRKGEERRGRDETILPTTAAEIEDCLRTAKDDCVAMIVASQDEGDFNAGLETGETRAFQALFIRGRRVSI